MKSRRSKNKVTVRKLKKVEEDDRRTSSWAGTARAGEWGMGSVRYPSNRAIDRRRTSAAFSKCGANRRWWRSWHRPQINFRTRSFFQIFLHSNFEFEFEFEFEFMLMQFRISVFENPRTCYWFVVGVDGPKGYKEKFTKIDNENRVKETEVVEGGYLELGFSLFRVRLEVIEKGEKSSIIKSTIEYELNEENASNASLVSIQSLATIVELAKNYLNKNKPSTQWRKKNFSPCLVHE